jgi:MFS family permease
VPLGAIFGSIIGGLFQDKFGRRWALAASSTLSAICIAIAYTCDLSGDITGRRTIFLVAKGLQGFANGMILVTAETYMSETLPTALRGPGLALFPIFTLLGQLIGSIVVQTSLSIKGPASYRICFASQWPFTVLPVVVAYLLPESPPWLIRMRQIGLAHKNFRRLQSKATLDTADEEFKELQKAVALEQERSDFNDVSYSQCFQGVDLRRTGVVVFATLLPNLFGLPLFATASYYLQTIGMDVGTSVIFIIIGVVLGLVSNIAAFWTLTFFGRRTLILFSLGAAVLLWISVGIAGFFSGPTMIWCVTLSWSHSKRVFTN